MTRMPLSPEGQQQLSRFLDEWGKRVRAGEVSSFSRPELMTIRLFLKWQEEQEEQSRGDHDDPPEPD